MKASLKNSSIRTAHLALLVVVSAATIFSVLNVIKPYSTSSKDSTDSYTTPSDDFETNDLITSEDDTADGQPLNFDNSDRTTYIQGLEQATPSLQAALVGELFNQIAPTCNDASWSPQGKVFDVVEVVRNDFAAVRFCDSGATRVLAHENSQWTVVTTLAEAPHCQIVDQYRLTKEIVSYCYETDAAMARPVVYP